jgi:hypothetical protein
MWVLYTAPKHQSTYATVRLCGPSSSVPQLFDTNRSYGPYKDQRGVLVCACAWEPAGLPSQAPLEDHSLDPHRKPSVLQGWILEIICCDPTGIRQEAGPFCGSCLRKGEVVAFWGSIGSEGPGMLSVRLWWEFKEPKGPKGP